MRLSTRGRYATRALLDIALHSSDKPVLLRDIAGREEISVQYLEHLIAPLKAAGILKSIRGARGGLALARLPSQIRIGEVIQIMEGSVSPVECVDNPNVCPRSPVCATRDIWVEVKTAIDSVLESTTLQDLVERQMRKERGEIAMYYI